MKYRYKTIEKSTEALFKDKGSRFLAFADPVQNTEQIKSILSHLKELHPKAVHHCYAYRLGTNGEDYRANDDGEPSGSAGRPILGQIDSLEIVNVCVVVVRYFGGVLLGVPGLINAYKTATQEALESAIIIEKSVMISAELTCDYSSLGEILNIIKQVDGEIISTEMTTDCKLSFQIPLENKDTFESRMEKFYDILCNYH